MPVHHTMNGEPHPRALGRSATVLVAVMFLLSPFAAMAVAPGDPTGPEEDTRAAQDPDEWLTFKGDNQRTGVAASEAPSVNDVLWRVNYKGSVIYSSPTVWNGTVYIGISGTLRALWAKNGTERWVYSAPNPVHSSPVIDNGIIFAGANDYSGTSAFAVDAQTGQEVWRAPIPDFVTSTPLAVGDSVYFGCENSVLYCLKRSDGAERWNFTVDEPIRYGAISYSNGRIFFGTMADSNQGAKLHALNATTGDEDWNATVVGSLWSAPCVVSGSVLVSTAADNPAGGGEWRNGYVYALDESTGGQRWRTKNLGMVMASPSVDNDKVYIGTFGKILPPRYPDHSAQDVLPGPCQREHHLELHGLPRVRYREGVELCDHSGYEDSLR